MATSGTGGTGRYAQPDLTSIVDKSGRPTAGKVKNQDEFMQEMRDNYDRARQRDHENIIEAYLDLGFRGGDAQWDATALNERQSERRPCMIINLIPQFIRQVTGEQRQMRPAIKVVGVDNKSDIKTAEAMEGLIRYIERRSDAQDAYNKGAEQQVTAGIGHWRVTSEYASDSTFEQELSVRAIDDGISVLWDPDATKPSREDANFCFVPVDMSRKKFETLYPGKTADDMNTHDYQWRTEWATDDHVRVSEYWKKRPITKKLALLPDGSTVDLDTIKDPLQLAQIQSQAEIREREGHEIVRWLVSLTEILEDEQISPGRYIPIVPCFGEEVRIGRRLIRHGMVRFMRDPQRIYNYYASAEVEVTAMQPKAPFMGTEINFADTLDMWQTANTKNYPFLIYRPDPQTQGKPPERVAPPVSSQGILEGIARAEQDMWRVTGIYPPSLGQQSNETSGKAVSLRQGEGDTGTFVYIDNWIRSIRHTGTILVDMIPHIYDSQRQIRILREDGRVEPININQPTRQIQGLDIITKIENDLTVGSYQVQVEVGPTFATRREEAKQGMITLLQTIPQFGPLLMDLVAQAQDWPLAEVIADRAKLLLPPNLLMAEMLRDQGVPEEQIRMIMLKQAMQPQPDPKQEVEKAKTEHEQLKTKHEGVRLQRDIVKGQMEQQRAQTEMAVDQAEAGQKMQHARHQMNADALERNHDIIMKRMDQQMAMIKLITEQMKMFHAPKNGQQSDSY
jgi:hypothetical protein